MRRQGWLRRSGRIWALAAAAAVLLVGAPGASSAATAAGSWSARPQTLSGVSVSLSTTAAVPGVTYTVQFTTSATGGLASGRGQITLKAPAGTVFPSETVSGITGAFINDIYDVTAGQDLGYSRGGVLSDHGAAATWTVEPTIPAGHVIRLTIEGITNAGVGRHELDVSTSGDPDVVQAPYSTTKPKALTAPSVTLSSSTAAGRDGVTYTVEFTTSSTGELAAGNGQITLKAPAGTVFPVANVGGVEGAFINDVYDVTAGQDLGYSRGGVVADHGATATWTVEPQIPAGHVIRLTIEGVTNPAVGSYRMGISTSSDPAQEMTPSYATTAPHALISPQVWVTQPAVAHEGQLTYTVRFETSSTGALVPGYGQITLAAPSGTVFPVQNLEGVYGAVINDVYDVTTGQDLGFSRGGVLSDGGSTATWTLEPAIGANQVIDLTISGMTNPGQGTYKLGVSTSSDTKVETAAYTIGPSTLPSLTGTVSYNDGSGLVAVAGSYVQACDADGCWESIDPTDSAGGYQLYVPGPGSYTVTAFAPTTNEYSAGEGSTGPVSVVKGDNKVNVTLPPLNPLPAGVTFNGQSGTVASVYWDYPSQVSVPGCQGGTGAAFVSSVNSQTGSPVVAFGALTETPAGSGTYTATVPPLYPSHGTGAIQTAIQCESPTALLPRSGPGEGGTEVQINGSGFAGATAVTFGSKPAESFTVASDDEIDAVAPPGSGTVAVSVVTPQGTIASASLAQYTYVSVDSVSPDSGPVKGGTTVTLTGSGFSGVEAVYFAGRAAASVTIDSDTKLTAVAPAGVSGPVVVSVMTADGGHSDLSGPSFSYGSGKGAARSAGRIGSRPAPGPAVAAPVVTSAAGVPAHPDGGFFESFSDALDRYNIVNDIAYYMAENCRSESAGSAFVDAVRQWAADGGGSDLAWSTSQGYAGEAGGQAIGWATRNPAWVEGLPEMLGFFGALSALEALSSNPSLTQTALTDDWNCARGTLGYIPPDQVNCSGNTCQYRVLGQYFQVRIDPSGTVEDTNGAPVPGATVTLLQSDGKLGPFTAPPSGSPIMAPSVNPETTDAGGAFHWDVFAGYYQVTASKAGCATPGHPARPVVSTPVFQVPPPKVGLVLTLQCKGAGPSAKPQVSGLSSASGPASGGTRTEISGSGFTGAAKVSFGQKKAVAVTVLSPTAILATAPAGSGTVAVRVTTAHGTSTSKAKDRFSYLAAAKVTRIAPADGPARGGTMVTITGTGFAAGDQVQFGTAFAPSETVVSATRIFAVAPAGLGTSDVRVINVDGASAKTSADLYGYAGRPVLVCPRTVKASVGKAVAVAIEAGGYPAPVVGETGRLPAGLKFTTRTNGTAAITGKPATAGRFAITIWARNRYGKTSQKVVITISRKGSKK
ncbi:MAG TPA: IPT/TIG domain-containing protein [Streptosporangiaceae bacterium]|nr:IPT/TIG domain-containing protein [Streptosporangiaceae bacterium]